MNFILIAGIMMAIKKEKMEPYVIVYDIHNDEDGSQHEELSKFLEDDNTIRILDSTWITKSSIAAMDAHSMIKEFCDENEIEISLFVSKIDKEDTHFFELDHINDVSLSHWLR
ncbi:hypothetical protein [Leptospira interrogans]|uniref:hypothetical protein n=1 Tax=Leptospira interrogans TaxID=173 RepID=UPI0011DF05E2|nr:hypothetical protein [Leptospira interrogans]QEH98733.1 hypothetical protein FWJ33_04210 [Leptospira interrogans serovar Hardjo]